MEPWLFLKHGLTSFLFYCYNSVEYFFRFVHYLKWTLHVNVMVCNLNFQLQHFAFRLLFWCLRLMISFCCSLWALRNLWFKTCRVIERNISSTFTLSLAEVSNSSMSICRAKRWASSVITTLRSGSSFLLPTKNTAHKFTLELQQHQNSERVQYPLSSLPNTLFTTSQLFCISSSHLLTLANDSPLVTSYTIMTPCVPL